MENFVNLLLGPAGTLVLALIIIYGNWRKWWVPGWLYRDKEAEAQEWKEAALKGTHVAERLVDLHETTRREER